MATQTPPKAVVFDLGKVLVDFDYGIAVTRLMTKAEVAEQELRSMIDHSPLLFRYETGKLSTREFYDEVRRVAKFTGSLEEFRVMFSDIFEEIKEMVAFQRALSRAGIPTYIFSNTNEMAATHIRERFPFFRGFTGYVLSYEVGCMKPEPPIYQAVEQTSGLDPGDLLYLDDRLENVLTAERRGWRAIHHRTTESSLKVAAELGLPTGR